MGSPHVEGHPEQQGKRSASKGLFFQPFADPLAPNCMLVLLGFRGFPVCEVLVSWKTLQSSPSLNHGP